MNDFLTQAAPLASRPYVGIYGFHNYNIGSTTAIDGEISKLNQIRDDFDDRPNWMTEFSKGDFDWLETARVIHNTLVEANSSAYIFWKLVWGESTSIDEIMINIDGAGNYVVGPTYYAIKHYAKHISRGYQRFDVTGSNTNVRASGYLSPDGRKVTLVIINTGGAPTGISLRPGGLPVSSATAFRTRQYDVAGNPYQALGAVNLANNQTLASRSMTTFVIDLVETLAPYDPALLLVEGIPHPGNQVSIAMPSQPVNDFILWKSTNLAAGSWQKVTNAVFTDSGGQLIITDPTPPRPPGVLPRPARHRPIKHDHGVFPSNHDQANYHYPHARLAHSSLLGGVGRGEFEVAAPPLRNQAQSSRESRPSATTMTESAHGNQQPCLRLFPTRTMPAACGALPTFRENDPFP